MRVITFHEISFDIYSPLIDCFHQMTHPTIQFVNVNSSSCQSEEFLYEKNSRCYPHLRLYIMKE